MQIDYVYASRQRKLRWCGCVNMLCDECGFDYCDDLEEDISRHALVHRECLNGIELSRSDGIYFVTSSDSGEMQQIACKVTELGRRETLYDFPFFSVGESSEPNLIVCLWVDRGYVVGVIVTRERNCTQYALLRDFRLDPLIRLWVPTCTSQVLPQTRRSVEFVWVLKACRRRGVANKIFEALSEHLELEISELGHSAMFTTAGFEFWRKQGTVGFFLAEPQSSR